MRGLSLLETIVSTFIFVTVVLLVLNFGPTSVISLSRGEQRARAGLIAQSRLNEARARPFSSLVVGSTPLYDQEHEGVRYRWRLQVSTPRADQPGRLRALLVRVEWDDRFVEEEVWVANVTR